MTFRRVLSLRASTCSILFHSILFDRKTSLSFSMDLVPAMKNTVPCRDNNFYLFSSFSRRATFEVSCTCICPCWSSINFSPPHGAWCSTSYAMVLVSHKLGYNELSWIVEHCHRRRRTNCWWRSRRLQHELNFVTLSSTHWQSLKKQTLQLIVVRVKSWHFQKSINFPFASSFMLIAAPLVTVLNGQHVPI